MGRLRLLWLRQCLLRLLERLVLLWHLWRLWLLSLLRYWRGLPTGVLCLLVPFGAFPVERRLGRLGCSLFELLLCLGRLVCNLLQRPLAHLLGAVCPLLELFLDALLVLLVAWLWWK